jgi:antitoxin HigA-1
MSSMYSPPHPGLLLDEYLGDISLAEAARRLGITRATLSRIRNGHAGITADMAVRLSLLLGASAELWLGMQSSYDLWVARQKPQSKVLALVEDTGINSALAEIRSNARSNRSVEKNEILSDLDTGRR